MYGYDYEYPYVDFAELADTVEGTGLLPYAPPAVPVTDEEDTPVMQGDPGCCCCCAGTCGH